MIQRYTPESLNERQQSQKTYTTKELRASKLKNFMEKLSAINHDRKIKILKANKQAQMQFNQVLNTQ